MFLLSESYIVDVLDILLYIMSIFSIIHPSFMRFTLSPDYLHTKITKISIIGLSWQYLLTHSNHLETWHDFNKGLPILYIQIMYSTPLHRIDVCIYFIDVIFFSSSYWHLHDFALYFIIIIMLITDFYKKVRNIFTFEISY